MASFTITANGTSAGQALTSQSVAIFLGGTFDGAKVRVEASPDNSRWATIASSQDVGAIGQGQSGSAVAQCVLPSGWYVRTVTINAGASTNVTVAVQ